jgi:hypothetical protein
VSLYLTGARTAVAAAIRPGVAADVVIVDAPRNVDPLTSPLVIVAPRRLEPFGTACPGPVVTLDVWCVAASSEPGPGDTEAETLSDAVLSALDAAGITWTDAERGTYADVPAWKITTEWTGS